MKTPYAKYDAEIYIERDERPKEGQWVIVSQSPQGTYFISAESSYTLTKHKDDAATFENYENAVAMLEDFKSNVFVEDNRQRDIVHFMHIEKYSDL